jgi:hypothetical protein
MKKTLLTIALVTASVAAFAQGKVSLQNDSGSLYTLAQAGGSQTEAPGGLATLTLRAGGADAAAAGSAIAITGPLPSGVTLEIGLYGGTSSSSLTLQTHTLLNPSGGGTGPSAGQGPFTHVVTGLPGGVVDYFQVCVWDSAYASPQAALAAGSYYGGDNIFSMTPGTSISYPAINSSAAPANSTWAAAGNENPLYVGVLIPEPTTFALAGLGAAALVIFRRRK